MDMPKQLRLTGRFFHRTTLKAARAIQANGFRDKTGFYLTSQAQRCGVWLSNVPLDCNEGAWGDVLLEVRIPSRLIKRFEWVEKGKGYREFLVPADLVNARGRIREVEEA